MPELPEVETIVRGLNQHVIGCKITGVWIDWAKTITTHSVEAFEREIKGRTIHHAHRRAKYIMINLSGNKTLMIHQKISGHLLYGKWKPNPDKQATQKWLADIKGPIKDDPFNRFIRCIIMLDNEHMLGLSDIRRFAKIYLGNTDTIEQIHDIRKLGPEPLDKNFTFVKFQDILSHRRGAIKKVLMNPYIIAGIGNIYGDEILWYAGIHPLRKVETLTEHELRAIYKYIALVLKRSIAAHGDSQQDYRTLTGEFGSYQKMHRAYQLTGKPCQKKDGGVITRVVINSRSAHFCPIHQKL